VSYLRNCGRFACCAALLLSATTVAADDTTTARETAGKITPREPTRFVRVRYDEFKSPVALQTASAKYVLPGPNGKNELEVVLEGVIHIGDRSYYREFNRRFRHYDVVLYELVAPPEKLIPDLDEKQPHPLRLLQQVTSEGLGFASQIEEIDYKAANMVHSDLSPAELASVSKGRGDDEITMLLEILTDILRKKNVDGDAARNGGDADGSDAAEGAADSPAPASSPDDPEPADDAAPSAAASDASETTSANKPPLVLNLRLLADPDGAVKIRRLLAKAFDASPTLESMLRPSQHATLIKARNKRALEVFQKQLDDGKRHIALFWGAGHMADFERELVLTYGLQPAGVVWRDAWDLREGAVAARAAADEIRAEFKFPEFNPRGGSRGGAGGSSRSGPPRPE